MSLEMYFTYTLVREVCMLRFIVSKYASCDTLIIEAWYVGKKAMHTDDICLDSYTLKKNIYIH